MARQTTEKEAQEFIAFTRAYTDKLISEGPEACKAFLDKVVPPTFPCDYCASDGTCKKHGSCKEYQDHLKKELEYVKGKANQ
jgi:hypothetical protein